MPPTRVVGLLSGTSVDGIDVAAADLELTGDTVELTPLGATEVAFPPDLRAAVLDALPPAPCSAEQLCLLDTRLGQAFAEAARAGITQLADGHADLIASLGQTVYHWIDADGHCQGTLQLGQPAWIAEATGLPVVADLRVRDVAAGGHGAPLVGVLDRLWLADLAAAGRVPVALNIGGIANITVVTGETGVLAYDTGPGNALLDAACRMISGGTLQHDVDGELARAGTVRQDLLDRLLADPYYTAAPPKSTGKERFHVDYLRSVLEGLPAVRDTDLLATLTELTAVTVADACRAHGADLVVASGGGVRNPALMAALARRLGDIELATSDDLGVPVDAKEAYLTALLGFLTWHGLASNVPEATGARGPRVLGSITPGRSPLRLPPPATTTPARLRVRPPAAPAAWNPAVGDRPAGGGASRR
ncbi:MAG TPA: anhydro-N-acetylmuramic acid kinase [Pseudonocardiaceae bacterium]